QDQLKAHVDEKMTIQGRLTSLKEEISQLEMRNHEQDSAIQEVEEKIWVNVSSVDLEKSALLRSREMIASLENKLADVPDQAKLIL
ncbi:hypothetical protein PJP10_32330, partial [Mycobacterium kansasii]